MKRGKNVFRLGELFCGPGGIGLGAKKTCVESGGQSWGIQNSWATDYDKDSCDTYAGNICPEKNVVRKDIREINFQKLKSISEVDALSFGFPCNDFSVVGEQKGIDGAYGPLCSYCVEALKFFQPKWFFAENVSGLRNVNKGKTFETLLDEFYSAGYSVYPHLYSFNDYGVPQTRRRIIIVGIRSDIPVTFTIPSPAPYMKMDVSCRSALEKPPMNKGVANNEITKHSPAVVERLKHIRPGENAFTANLPARLKLNVNGAKISQIYRRINPDKPAYTVTGSGGGGTHVYHWKEPRALTNRERARLQTFPDDFVFQGSKESVRKQIGMAVPPEGARVLLEAVLKCFAGIKYESVASLWKPLIQHADIYNSSLGTNGQKRVFETADYDSEKGGIYAANG